MTRVLGILVIVSLCACGATGPETITPSEAESR
jgi:hypothetical protein